MITTSARRERAACTASNTTAPGSAPACCWMMSAPRAVRPDAQLLDGRGAKRVARGEHHVFARVGEAARELADGGGLAGAVHADHQHHEGLAR